MEYEKCLICGTELEEEHYGTVRKDNAPSDLDICYECLKKIKLHMKAKDLCYDCLARIKKQLEEVEEWKED